jgi:hypothetical protein
MGVMNWFAPSVGGLDPASRAPVRPAAPRLAGERSMPSRRESHPNELDGFDVAGYIRAHQGWKRRLAAALGEQGAAATDAALDPDTLWRDDCCSLGRWMRSNASCGHRGRAVFRDLFGTHAAMHQAAAEVISLQRAGQARQAREMLERGLFARNSVCVQGLLAQLVVGADPQSFPVLLTDEVRRR